MTVGFVWKCLENFDLDGHNLGTSQSIIAPYPILHLNIIWSIYSSDGQFGRWRRCLRINSKIQFNISHKNLNFFGLAYFRMWFANLQISQMIEAGTKSNKNFSWKKCIFALANLQNYKREKIRMDDMILQVHWVMKNLWLITSIWKHEDARYLVFIVDICNLDWVAISWSDRNFKKADFIPL